LLAMENKLFTLFIQWFDDIMITKEFHVVISFVGGFTNID
jgi:hypothetical protein